MGPNSVIHPSIHPFRKGWILTRTKLEIHSRLPTYLTDHAGGGIQDVGAMVLNSSEVPGLSILFLLDWLDFVDRI